MKNLNKILPWFSLGAVIGLVITIPVIITNLTCFNSTYGCFYSDFGFIPGMLILNIFRIFSLDGSALHLIMASIANVIAFGLLGIFIGGLVLAFKKRS